MARVAVVGSYGVGLMFAVERLPERGETLVGEGFRTDHGGKGSNQAVGAARLGAEVALLTAVGEDTFGEGALRLWEAEGSTPRPCCGCRRRRWPARSSSSRAARTGS